MENKTDFGRHGEDLAVEFLLKEGYEILERNWYFRHNEVDIVARDKDTLVVIEVKTRSGNSYGEPYTAVDHRKQQYLIFAAERYIFANNLDVEVRFDIISIIIDHFGKVTMEHVKEAFHPIARSR
jgi:putative endonuclease